GTALQLALDRLVQVANNELSHFNCLQELTLPDCYHDSTCGTHLQLVRPSPLLAVQQPTGDEVRTMDIKVGRQAIQEATDKLKNWGRWGKDDQIGTLNHVRAQDIVNDV